ncbi:MAG: type II secretion system protein [Desulfobacterales bacterium]|nr:type II secretion system protein [Desulfobacterales bacterium]
MLSRPLSNQKGFTLIESMVVCIVLGILFHMGLIVYRDMNRRGKDAMAITDGRNLITAVEITFINLETAYYDHNPVDGSEIGTQDYPSGTRAPVFVLSSGTRVESTGESTGFAGEGFFEADVWHKDGSKLGGVPRKFHLLIDEQFNTISLPDNIS